MNLLAVRQDNNGDVLLAGPAIRALAGEGARITLLCGPSGRAAAEALPRVHEVICCEAEWIEATPRAVSRDRVDALVGAIAARNFDRAIIFTSFHQSPLPVALLLRMAGVPWLGAICEDYPGSLLDLRHRGVPENVHEVQRALSLAHAAGFTLPRDDAGRLAMRVGKDNPAVFLGRYVVVHPGATVAARAWTPALNRELVAELATRGESVVVTGSAQETPLCRFVAGNNAVDLSGKTDFTTLGAVIAGAEALVVGNTGAAHVAAAVGTPVVSIFPPTIPAVRFRPWMVDHVLLGDQTIACRGCRARICPRHEQYCVTQISVASVLEALAELRAARPYGANTL